MHLSSGKAASELINKDPTVWDTVVDFKDWSPIQVNHWNGETSAGCGSAAELETRACEGCQLSSSDLEPQHLLVRNWYRQHLSLVVQGTSFRDLPWSPKCCEHFSDYSQSNRVADLFNFDPWVKDNTKITIVVDKNAFQLLFLLIAVVYIGHCQF